MIPYGSQWIDNTDIKSVIQVLKSPFLTTGPLIARFENEFAMFVNAKYAVAVANGTAALHLAVLALDIEKGSEGITSPNTFVASSNAFLYNGIQPVFADIDAKTYNIHPQEIKKQLTSKTKVVIPVDFAGQPADMDRINTIANKHGLFVIEDAAHALGSKYKNGKMVGSCCYSDLTTFSFHPVKTITTGEGGIITTNNRKLYERLKKLRNHGIEKEENFLNQNPGPWYYEMQELGYNFRMTDFQAALGLSQLKKIRKFIQRRKEIVETYNKHFNNLSWLKSPYEEEGVNSVFHLYVALFDFQKIGKTRKQVMEYLFENGIGTQVHYIPVYLQPYYQKNFGFREKDYPQCESYYKRCLSLPLYPKMTNRDVQKVIKHIKELY
ncbi:UDP-4-amino-4,6-dideoxy-N-acetyl-beta-L-altrosamine transaminase [Candidatus Gottesmanbacteria bacterium]|nr:UDP-4-amino-4,6-dideoxy-N-acetyl-beta-L-altrosamine transaminase [Candidatus Gottesmanbacteria bacterium]